jgi:hypothetical protein
MEGYPPNVGFVAGLQDERQTEQMRLARKKFEDRGRPPHGSFMPLKGSATITGVAFFDVKHSNPQHGVAQNNIELHPVLRFSYPTCPPV